MLETANTHAHETVRPPSAPSADARVRALRRFAASITIFNIVGHLFLGFEQPWAQPIVALAAAYTFELGFEILIATLHRRSCRFRGGMGPFIEFLLPAHITALAIAMLMYPNSRMSVVVFAVALAISSKVLFRIRVNGASRHFFNPSNFGIAVTLILLPSVGIAPPYHFTERISGLADWALPTLIGAAGLMLNLKLTRKGPLIAAWLAGFVVQALVRSALFDTPVVAGLLPMTAVAFILFTNYMITDPGTTPVAPARQALFGAAVAGVYGVLVAMHIVFGLFFALVIVSGVRGLFVAVANGVGVTRADRWQPSVAAPVTVSSVAGISVPVAASQSPTSVR